MPISLVIDPGQVSGFAVLEVSVIHHDAHRNMQPGGLIQHGTIQSSKRFLSQRLRDFQRDIVTLIIEKKVTEIAIEKFFYGSLQSEEAVESLGAVCGIVKDTTLLLGLPKPYGIQNSSMKRIAGESGRADKDAVKRGVCKFWALDPGEIFDYNHSDALGLAMAWALEGGLYRQKRTEKNNVRQMRMGMW